MLKENELMVANLLAEMTPHEMTDMNTWENESELRRWCSFFETDPTRAEVLAVCLEEQQAASGIVWTNWKRVWVVDEMVDAMIQKVFAFTEVPMPVSTFMECDEED